MILEDNTRQLIITADTSTLVVDIVCFFITAMDNLELKSRLFLWLGLFSLIMNRAGLWMNYTET